MQTVMLTAVVYAGHRLITLEHGDLGDDTRAALAALEGREVTVTLAPTPLTPSPCQATTCEGCAGCAGSLA